MTVGFSPGRLASRLVGRRPANVVLDGPAWNPGRIPTLRQRFLDVLREYYSSTLDSYPILTPEESGTVAVPRAGRCFLFDGSDDYGTITDAALRTNGTLTISAWIKTTSNTAAQAIVWCGNGAGSDYYGLTYGYTDNKLGLWHNGGGEVAVSNSLSLAGSWNHVAVVRSGSSGSWTITFFVNGVAAGTSTTSTNPSGSLASPLAIGRVGSASSFYFSGSMRDVRIANVAKSPTEVLAIANQELHPDEVDHVGILAHWWCEDEAGDKARDASGNGHDLTLMNTTAGTFHAVDSGVTYSAANELGHSIATLMNKPGATAGWDSGVFSVEAIPAATDGYLQCQATDLNSYRMIGLSETNSGGADYNAIPYAIYLAPSGDLFFYESTPGPGIVGAGTYAAGDILQIVRTGTTITYKKNGTTVRTASEPSSTELHVDTSFFSENASVFNVLLFHSGSHIRPTYSSNVGVTLTDCIIPRDESDPTLDVLGNTLQYPGPIKLPATTEVPCVTGDGSAVYLNFGSLLPASSTDFTLSFRYYHTGTGNVRRLVDSRDNSSATILTVLASGDAGGTLNEGYLALQVDTVSGSATCDIPAALAVNTWCEITVSRVSNTWAISNGALSANCTLSGALAAGLFLSGAYNASGTPTAYQSYPGRISDFQVTTGGVTKYVKLQEGPGDDNTNRTVYIVGSDGSVSTGSIVGGTVANIWANRNPYGRDHQLEYGGRLTTQNLLTHSEQFDNAAWNKVNSTVTANATAGPDGSTAAEALIDDATNGGHSIQCPETTTTAQTYTLSVYARANTLSRIMVYSLNADGKGCGFDLSNGTTFTVSGITMPASYAITDAGNGWYRCSIVFTGTAVTQNVGAFYCVSGTDFAYSGSGQSVYVWGAQLNVGSTASEYQPTTASAVPANVFVPALLDGSECADGRAITLTAGKHANPGSRIVPNIWNAPSLVRLGYTSSTKLAPGDAVQSISPADTKFRRTAADGDDRYFVSDTPLVGINLINAQDYTA